MNNKQIVLASLLKPIFDTRMYEKIGTSISSLQDTTLTIIGCQQDYVNKTPSPKNINFLSFKTNANKLTNCFFVLNHLLKNQPKVFIASSPELFIVAAIYKVFNSKSITIFDYRENHVLNWKHQSYSTFFIKHIISKAFSLIEKASSLWINKYFLAEKIYMDQLPHVKHKNAIVLENKAIKPNFIKRKPTYHQQVFLFSGTLSDAFGVFEAINFFKIINTGKSFKLKIVGYSANLKTLKEIKNKVANNSCIELITSNSPIAHNIIIEEILNADFGLAPYSQNKSIQNKFPTTVYEYLAYQLPIIYQEKSTWEKLIINHNGGIAIDFKSHYQSLDFIKNKFYDRASPSESLFWSNEEPKLLNYINDIFNDK